MDLPRGCTQDNSNKTESDNNVNIFLRAFHKLGKKYQFFSIAYFIILLKEDCKKSYIFMVL